ncbi:MAG: hypothetical protein M0R17_05300 [Candidatus Omnitrophica bacterium]|nr:hypothetical protein [Candidatus Omnitrophota bacterium]
MSEEFKRRNFPDSINNYFIANCPYSDRDCDVFCNEDECEDCFHEFVTFDQLHVSLGIKS